MSDNPMLIAALKYASMGWHIFPCWPGTKAPLTLNGVKGATCDPDMIKAWWTKDPQANIALACGKGENPLYCVDVDVDVEKGVDGWKTITDLAATAELPETVYQLTPRGGKHFLYQTDKPPRNKNSLYHGIDIRGEGYYIMLAPSVHPNGKVYEWGPGHGPGEVPYSQFPEFMRPPETRRAMPWERKSAPAEAVPVPEAPAARHSSPPSSSVIDRARLYLQEVEPATQGQAGHDKLLWAARTMVIGFELSDSEALSLLWSEYNPRCNPPWDAGKPAEVRDFERKVREARSSPGEKPAGWLLDECGLRVNDEAKLTRAREWAERMLAKAEEKMKKVEPVPEQDQPFACEYAEPEIIRAKPRLSTAQFPDWILNPPGLVGQLTRWINDTAGCYQPGLALAAAFTACGAVMGRKVRDESNGRTNLYMMGVANSSAGKDHPGACIMRLFEAAGADVLIGGSRVTSDAAIEVALQTNPTQLYCWDELGHMFAAIKQAGTGSGGASYLRTIVPCLMELYSSADRIYKGKQRAEGELAKIYQPSVSVWGVTSPDVLYDGISRKELRDGWLGRVITVISHDQPKYIVQKYSPPPESLVAIISAWATRIIPPPEGTGSITGAIKAWQIDVPANALATSMINDFRDECHDKMVAAHKKGDDTCYLWGKGLQNARRIALILACGDSYDNPEITEYHVKYASEMIRTTIKQFALAITGNVADNDFEREKLRILKLLRAAGPLGMSKMEFTRRTQGLRDRKVRQAYIDELSESGQIVFWGKNPKHPEARSGWLWLEPFAPEAEGERSGVRAEEGKAVKG
jgi:hypothetical protein